MRVKEILLQVWGGLNYLFGQQFDSTEHPQPLQILLFEPGKKIFFGFKGATHRLITLYVPLCHFANVVLTA
jgi:hypothetical protein